MNGRGRRAKGQQGERELASMLSPFIQDKQVKRNLDQVREGGADIMDIPGLCIEVKRQESLNLTAWWQQVCTASSATQIPVLAYRQNRRPWTFCLPAHLLVRGNPGYVQMNEGVFFDWLVVFLRS